MSSPLSPTRDRIPLRKFIAPRYWPTWLALWLMWLLAHLPYGWQVRLGRLIGLISLRLARERREICRINLALCFPDLSDAERERLLRDTFISNGIGVMEVALSWSRRPEDFRERVAIEGLEHLRSAKASGRGVLLLCAHFSTLEFGGSLLTLFDNMAVTYRPHKNRLFNAVMFNARNRLFEAVIERENVRAAFRALKQGQALWYAPDQDYGARRAVFVPFFGVPAATITATSRFAAANNSVVLFFSHFRTNNNTGYHLRISPPIDNYPSGDEKADAIKINGLIEAAIRKHPDQYLWMHKRFKTQAAGKAASPYRKITRR